MAISIDESTFIITIPQADLTPISGTLYELDTNALRLELRDWEDDEAGIVHPKTHTHNTEYEIAGVTYARAFQIISPYSITFEDGQYSVILVGTNNNVWDIEGSILNQNQVQVIPTNSAGLITVSSGSGLSAGQDAKLTRLFELFDEVESGFDAQDVLKLLAAVLAGKASVSGDVFTFRDLNDTDDRVTATTTADGERTAVSHNV